MYTVALFIDAAIYVQHHILKCWASGLTVIGSSAAGKRQEAKCAERRCFTHSDCLLLQSQNDKY